LRALWKFDINVITKYSRCPKYAPYFTWFVLFDTLSHLETVLPWSDYKLITGVHIIGIQLQFAKPEHREYKRYAR